MIVARRVHQILGVRLIHHGKIRVEPDGFPIGSQQSICNGVKGATPDGSEGAASGLTQGSPGPAQHLVRSPAREREKHDPARIDPLRHEPSHPRRKSFGLASAGSGNGKNWPSPAVAARSCSALVGHREHQRVSALHARRPGGACQGCKDASRNLNPMTPEEAFFWQHLAADSHPTGRKQYVNRRRNLSKRKPGICGSIV